MSKHVVHFFENPGRENTDRVIESAKKRVQGGDVEAVIVPSVSGETAIKVAREFGESDLSKEITKYRDGV